MDRTFETESGRLLAPKGLEGHTEPPAILSEVWDGWSPFLNERLKKKVFQYSSICFNIFYFILYIYIFQMFIAFLITWVYLIFILYFYIFWPLKKTSFLHHVSSTMLPTYKISVFRAKSRPSASALWAAKGFLQPTGKDFTGIWLRRQVSFKNLDMSKLDQKLVYQSVLLIVCLFLAYCWTINREKPPPVWHPALLGFTIAATAALWRFSSKFLASTWTTVLCYIKTVRSS